MRHGRRTGGHSDTWHSAHDQEMMDTQAQPKGEDLCRNTRRVDSTPPLGLTVWLIELEEIGERVPLNSFSTLALSMPTGAETIRVCSESGTADKQNLADTQTHEPPPSHTAPLLTSATQLSHSVLPTGVGAVASHFRPPNDPAE